MQSTNKLQSSLKWINSEHTNRVLRNSKAIVSCSSNLKVVVFEIWQNHFFLMYPTIIINWNTLYYSKQTYPHILYLDLTCKVKIKCFQEILKISFFKISNKPLKKTSALKWVRRMAYIFLFSLSSIYASLWDTLIGYW